MRRFSRIATRKHAHQVLNTSALRWMSCTRTLNISRKSISSLRDPNKPWEQYDTINGHLADEELFGDKEIFEDPSSQLFNEELQEMSEEELWDYMQRIVGAYDERIYCYLTIPVVDLAHIMLQRRLIPRVRSETVVCSWFGDPNLALRKPAITEEWMGKERWESFGEGADDLMQDISAVSPLHRVCEKNELPQDLWVPFMRQLSLEQMATAVNKQKSREHFASFFVALANGRGPSVLKMPEDEKARVVLLGNLMLGTAQESGNKDLAFAAIHLQQAHHITLSYAQQRALMNVFANTAKRNLDWDLRASGQLKRSVNDWLVKYFPSILSETSLPTEIEDAETVRNAPPPKEDSQDIADDADPRQIHSVSNIHKYFTHDHEVERDTVGRERRSENIVAVASKLQETREAKVDMAHARTLVQASLDVAEGEKSAAGIADVVDSPKKEKKSPTKKKQSVNQKLAAVAAKKMVQSRASTKKNSPKTKRK